MQKTAAKNSQYSKNETTLKIAKNGHNAKAIQPMQRTEFGSKNKIAWNMQKTSLQTHESCSLRKKRLEKTANIRKMRPF